MNTKIGFLYRDAGNYKQWNAPIVAGEFTEEDRRYIKDLLNEPDGGNFVPEQLGLSLLRPGEINEDDHPWGELDVDNLELTDETPTEEVTWADVMAGFRQAEKTGWQDWKYMPEA